MKFILRMPAALMLVLLLLTGSIAIASPVSEDGILPVLPLPKHQEQLEKSFDISSISKLNNVNLPGPVRERLSWHWEQFLNESSLKGNSSIRIGLLGKNKSFDKEVLKVAARWINQLGDEGYVLALRDDKPFIAARTESGLFYGLQSLKQLIRAGWNKEVMIADWPSLPHRIIYDDISRGPISTTDYIKKQIERMAEIKINGLSFYIEHVVQPLSHPDFAPADGKLTIAQIRELSAYAKKFHVQLIGSFQSFGHFEKILSLPQYSSLGATSTLISPTNAKAKKFLADVIGELCDAFDSPYFNVNCDETFDLGQGTTKAEVAKIGEAAYYANHLKFLYDIVHSHGKKMMMWGDFVIEHENVIDLLPKDIIYLTWEYGDQASFDHWIKPFASRGLSYMVCPGILNSYRMFPDMMMAKANIAGFVAAGKQQEAKGVITTIWDDGGTYLFSADWYGVYVAAEKSWTADTTGNVSFDQRYERTAYGTDNGNYVRALFKLMELRSLPLTYNLNDRLWQQKLLPDNGKKLIVNNTSADAALQIIDDADHMIMASMPARNQSDIRTLKFSIDQYRLMIESRLKITAIAGEYQQAVAKSLSADQTASMLTSAEKSINDLVDRYEQLKNEFRQDWLAENQPYWLDVVSETYDKKIDDLSSLGKELAAVKLQSSKPTAASLRLSIDESPSFYFQNWMLTGPFPVTEKNIFPSFLYSDNAEYNKPPSPGDFTQYMGKMYRWRKFASADGGIIDLDEAYGQKDPAFIYAYCYVKAENDITVQAFIGGKMATEIYCNGSRAPETMEKGNIMKASLTFKPGINHILLKLKKNTGSDSTFTFRLQDELSLTNHKHKYQLNAKKEFYDAE